MVFSPHIALNSSATTEQAYCLGLYKTRLPAKVGVSSINNLYLGPHYEPSIGDSCPGLEVFHHGANLPGCLGSSFLIPSSETAIVVLTNAVGLSDPTDCVGQLILSVVLGEKPYDGFVDLSKAVRHAALTSYLKLEGQLLKGKTGKPPQHPLTTYEGDYWNFANNFVLSINASNDSLLMTAQKNARVTYILLPYNGDTFYWPASREKELCEESKVPLMSPGWHQIGFGTNARGKVDRLLWGHDPMTKPEVFYKREKSNGCERAKM